LFQAQRHNLILKLLSEHTYCSLIQLAQALNISIPTARRDLNILQKEGVVKRTRGGAMFLGDKDALPLFQDRQSMMAREKAAIGELAASLVEDGDTIIIDGGTTPYQVAVHLQNKHIQVVTNSLPVANLFANSRNVQLISTGGLLHSGTGVYLGSYAVDMLKTVHAQKAFMGVAGVNACGFYNSNALVVETEKQILKAAAEVHIVSDHSKFGRNALAFLCDFSVVTSIITNKFPHEQDELTRKIEQNNVKIHEVAGRG
jgi:DeoR family transcriptional regulator, fructose operon transcriptional repressor